MNGLKCSTLPPSCFGNCALNRPLSCGAIVVVAVLVFAVLKLASAVEPREPQDEQNEDEKKRNARTLQIDDEIESTVANCVSPHYVALSKTVKVIVTMLSFVMQIIPHFIRSAVVVPLLCVAICICIHIIRMYVMFPDGRALKITSESISARLCDLEICFSNFHIQIAQQGMALCAYYRVAVQRDACVVCASVWLCVCVMYGCVHP